MSYKREIGLLTCIALLLVFSKTQCHAMENQNPSKEIPVLYSSYVDATRVSLNAIGGKCISISANAKAKTTANKISLTIELQKKNSNCWSTIKTWKKTEVNTYICMFSKQDDLSKKGTYRVKLIAKVYKNSSCETVTGYSGCVSV